MAIFEKRFERKVTLDDTQPITCWIETAQLVDGHTEYVLKLQRGPFADHTWKVLRRYNDFVTLNKSLSPSGISLPLPRKKVIGNMRPDFIAERRQALQEYINVVLMNPILASSLTAKRFVDPDSYSSSFHDQAQQNASLCLRTEGLYVLGQTMGLIGWRLRKHYFKVLPKSQGQSGGKHLMKSGSQTYNKNQSGNGQSDSNSSYDEYILSWTEYGPDKYIDDKELHSIFKSLKGLQHPYIEHIQYGACNENGALVVRKFNHKGTLKDILCMSTPKKPFLNKYGNPKGRTALSLRQVAIYGSQILEALRFLHSKGMPFNHLHSGNVVIIDDTVRLLDVENFILGVPSFYRPFFVQHSKINTTEAIDVYCFGHVLFEMSMGYPLQESVARQITDCPEALKHLLESILSKEACKSGLPSLDQLAQHRFFQEYTNQTEASTAHSHDSASNKPHFKLSTNAKEQIRIAMQKMEQRLKDEQKSVKNQKRLVRVQEMMSSEEEKKKSKQKAKLEHKQAKLRQQSSLQLQNGSIGPGSSPMNRADSATSVNTSNETTPAASIQSASPLPPPPPPPIGSLVGSGVSTSIEESECERSALLESICRFNRGSLRKIRSND